MSDKTPSPQSVVVRRADLEEVRDLLMERIYGSNARSPGHNARLAVEAMLAAAPVPSSLAGGEVDVGLVHDLTTYRDSCQDGLVRAPRSIFARALAALSPEAPARDVEAYDKFKAPAGSTVWIKATVTDNCTSCCSVVIDAIHGKMHLTVVPRDVALTPRHEAPASEGEAS